MKKIQPRELPYSLNAASVLIGVHNLKVCLLKGIHIVLYFFVSFLMGVSRTSSRFSVHI